MASRVRALAKPELLVWARESAGLTVEQAAAKARVTAERLEKWEAGGARPTVKQLRTLGRIYKRPLAVFYLADPPKTFKPLRDYRRLPGRAMAGLSPELRYEVRRAHERREIALELYQRLGEAPPEFNLSARLTQDPEELAALLRETLAISYDEQLEWSHPYDALNAWRSALERLGVLVFQVVRVDPAEMRAFSLAEFPLPVIAVNVKDSPHARVFSMLHEVTHLALREGGLCDLEESGPRPPEEQHLEIACNAIAGAILVPRERLLAEDVVRSHSTGAEWADGELAALSRRYRVSREVILRRLLLSGRTTRGFYRSKRQEFQKQEPRRPKGAPGFPSPPVMAVSTAGRLFIRLVLDSYYEHQITARDVSDFLDIRLKHMAKIEEAVLGRTVEFGAVA